jgi:hypothetical protein
VAVAKLIEGVLSLVIPTERPRDRRRKFTVIEGGKAIRPTLESRFRGVE